MHRTNWMVALALVGAGAFATSGLLAQDSHGHEGHGHQEGHAHEHGDMGGFEMPAELSPGPMHEHLNAFVGEWKAATKFWMEPGGTPEEGEGHSTSTWVLDGRWVMDDYKGEFGGMPFRGMAMTGYDPFKKKYISTWCDSMSTTMMVSEGTYDEANKVFTYTSKNFDPWMQMETTTKIVISVQSDDKHTMEMYTVMPDGAEFKGLEIVYTRVK